MTNVTERYPEPLVGRIGRTLRSLLAGPDWTLIASPAITLAVMLWGVSARPYWGDEADTVSAVSRTLPQLATLLKHIDAVHGLYYLLLWPVVGLAGPGEFATRLPSALAMAAAAAGVTAIGRRLASRSAGLWAGLLFAVLPTVTDQGHDARPYAMITAAAVLASYLLIRAVEDPRPRWFAAYGLSLALIGYVQLFGLLLVPAHAIALIGLGLRPRPAAERPSPGAISPVLARRALARRWLVTIAAVAVAVTPVAILGYVQRAQIAWIPTPGWHDVYALAATLIGAPTAAAVVIGLLGLFGVAQGGSLTPAGSRPAAARPGRGRRPDRGLAWLAVPWLVLPPFLLLTASAIMPVYFTRYVTYCLPAVALLAGAGLAALRWPVRAAALALVVALVAPTQLGLRTPGGGMQTVAEFLGAHKRPGDAILYPLPSIPPWYLAYPDEFARLRDISLARTPAASGRLDAVRVPLPVLEARERNVSRIWVVPMRGGQDPAGFLTPGFRLVHEWKLRGDQMVLLYMK